MSPEEPRSGSLAAWIVVAWPSNATANIQRFRHTHTDVSTANGSPLRSAREGGTPSAGTLVEDGRAESGGGATDGTRNLHNLGGRAPQHNNIPRSRRRRPTTDTPRADEIPRDRNRPPSGRKTKANIKIGTLNVSGKGLLYEENNKWAAIHRLMRDKKLGVMAIQETHLTDSDVKIIHDLYGRRIHILNSPDPTCASSARGVAFVLNREMVDTKSATITELIPGRAVSLKMKWHAETDITVVNVYAPNNAKENEEFWSSLREMKHNGRLPRTDVLLGDFNIVEDALDRLPVRDDPVGPQISLRELLVDLSLHDGWQITEPTTRDYTFPQRTSPNRSRLDRIYLSNELLSQSFEWAIESTGVPTDHRMVSARMTTAVAPYIGKGRWTMPLALLADQNFLRSAAHLGAQALKAAEESTKSNARAATSNPQLILTNYKAEVKRLAQAIQKKKVPKLEQAIKKAKESLSMLQKDPQLEHDATKQNEVSKTIERIQELERKREGLARLTASTKYTLNAEKVSKYWSRLNKDKKPRDLFFALRSESDEGQRYETRSDRMAELARNYHEKLQQDGIDIEELPEERQHNISEALGEARMNLSRDGAGHLRASVTRGDVAEALRRSATGKATGVDGIPYEFWTTLDARWFRLRGTEEPQFDCLQLLTLVYKDIEDHGTCKEAGFADGWMCPLYKKKDRRDIANYRPITLLNSDYKIYTKVLAMKLARVVTEIVHPDQAGFIPGRQISDQTQACRIMIDYAEAMEENGVIVALDQEKAYDKIAHDYLWEALAHFGIPEEFTTRLKSLYQHAQTVVILNGETSSPFRVTRGVRQGDPLSCLVFDIAIEPLACAMRASNLSGFEIPGAARRQIASLFADDTSTFLSSTDKWSDLWAIINRWCTGSRARFNRDKTEVIPIGSAEYRAQVLETRSIDGQRNQASIPENVHIAGDGESVRVLGAWIGNKVDQAATWAPILQKTEAFLDRWGRCHPTLSGRKNIIQMGPGGITQYLTMVQGMPKTVEHSLNAMIRKFLWKGVRTPPVSLDTLCLPVEEGGIGLLDLEARNEAIELTWTKRYLDLSPQRPQWAWAADALVSMAASADAGAISRPAQINTFLQSWKPSLGTKSKLPHYLRRMLTVAKKHHVSFAAIKLSRKAKLDLPIWYHLGAVKKLRTMNNSVRGKCLRKTHKVRTVAELLPLRAQHATHGAVHSNASGQQNNQCPCATCDAGRTQGCTAPAKCYAYAAQLLAQIQPKWHPDVDSKADGLSLTPGRKACNQKAKLEGTDILFDPSVTSDSPLEEAFRAFVDPSTHDRPPAIRWVPGRSVQQAPCTVYVLENQGKRPQSDHDLNTTIGFAESVGAHPWQQLVRNDAGDGPQYPGSGLVAATLYATSRVPRDVPLRLISDSEILREFLTTRKQTWEDKGWAGVKGARHIRLLINRLRQRCAPTTLGIEKSKGSPPMARAKRHLREEMQRSTTPTVVNVEADPAFELSGAKLSALSQALAYQSIRERKERKPRPATARMIERVLTHVQQSGRPGVTASEVWKNIRHPDYQRKIVDFLWKIMHNAHRVGSYWSKIPGLETRSQCAICGTEENIEHILFHCQAYGQQAVWEHARSLWEKKDLVWQPVCLESLLSAGIPTEVMPNTHAKQAHARLWRILVTESAHLIWRMRCERVIGHEGEARWRHTEKAVTTQWLRVMNDRMRQDITRTNPRFGRMALSTEVVEETWRNLVPPPARASGNWIEKIDRVLVGIDPKIVATTPDRSEPHTG